MDDDHLIDQETLKRIRSESTWEDEDTWVADGGRIVVYNQEKRLFYVKKQGKVLGRVPARAIKRSRG